MNKKILSALMAALVMLSAAGCGDGDSSSSKAESTADTSSQAEVSSAAEESEAVSEADPSEEEKTPQKVTKSLSMSVSKSDGKMSISRPEEKSTPMGEKDTWTIFIYLCGTDLESKEEGGGAATADIEQMLAAEASDNVKFVFQTGGTNNWNNDFISTEEHERWVVQNQEKTKIESLPQKNMGDSETFAEFLKWGVENYPAEKMGVIFWDHGGGSVTGACVDELNDGDTLDLMEINSALSEVYETMTDKFEFIGFDCCLMGTAEVANVLASYARYFYGSQETEPGSGWDYTTYGTYLAQNPGASGAELGKVIADSFYEECAQAEQENECTLSIIDLSKFDDFVVAFNDFSKTLYEAAASNLQGVVRGVSKADNFGGNNKSEGYTNMVDVGGIISQCSEYSDGSAALEALKNCLVYNKNGANHTEASGLSVYYPLKVSDSKELKTFSKITVSPYYLSIVDMIAKGFSEDGYDNSKLFDENGNWDNQTETEGEDYYNYADDQGDSKTSLITFEQEPTLSDSGSFGFKLDESGLMNAASASATIYMQTDEEGKYLILGETLDLNADWETGEFSDNFDGYWFALPNGTLLPTAIVSDEGDHSVYTSSILLNGKRTNLRIVKDGENVKIEGTWDGIDSNGMAAREIRKLKDGDKIVPVYDVFNNDSGEESTENGEEYKWASDSEITYAFLAPASYYYCFDITDVYSKTYTSKMVVFTIDEEGDISFSELEGGESEEGGEEQEQGEEEEE